MPKQFIRKESAGSKNKMNYGWMSTTERSLVFKLIREEQNLFTKMKFGIVKLIWRSIKEDKKNIRISTTERPLIRRKLYKSCINEFTSLYLVQFSYNGIVATDDNK